MSRRVRYQVAVTLDGFIAGPNGEYDWIVMDPAVDFAAFREAKPFGCETSQQAHKSRPKKRDAKADANRYVPTPNQFRP